MAKRQGRVETTGKEETRSKARESSTDASDKDPRTELVAHARAVKGAGARGKPPGGGGRDSRALREGAGANASRGKQPDVEEDEDEEKEEEEFWRDLVGEAYRSRKRRGDWEETGSD